VSVERLPLPSRQPTISEEEFLAWFDDPVTQWVISACRRAADENKLAWVEASWESGTADPLLLMELRTRADAYLALAETQWAGWLKAHGEDE
jgi:hypothetical protein